MASLNKKWSAAYKSEFKTRSRETFKLQNTATAQSLVDASHYCKTIACIILKEKSEGYNKNGGQSLSRLAKG